MPSIDLNADVGEIPAVLADGSEERLLGLVSSANIACGGHAGTAESMRAVAAIARRLGVAVGAHPSYPDRAGFGRVARTMSPAEITASVREQVEALIAAAGAIRHVKPHGALYHAAANQQEVAAAIATGVENWRRDIVLVGLAGSRGLDVWAQAGFRVAGEAFADRVYEADGSLRSRTLPAALIADPALATRQALEIIQDGAVTSSAGTRVAIAARTLCVHGDSPGAIAIAAAIRAAFATRGIEVRALE
jgi:UPF0271 protein